MLLILLIIEKVCQMWLINKFNLTQDIIQKYCQLENKPLRTEEKDVLAPLLQIK